MSVISILKLFCSWNTLFFPFLLAAFSLLVSGSSKNSDPIIIILGPPGLSLPLLSETRSQIESSLLNRDSSSSISKSSFNLFRSFSTNKKDKKDGPHIIFIGGSAAIPMNNNNNNSHNYNSNNKSGQIVGSLQGSSNLGAILGGGSAVGAGFTGGSEKSSDNTNINGFDANNTPSLSTGPMRRDSNDPVVSFTGNNYGFLPMNPTANSLSTTPNYPYIPYTMGSYNGPIVYPASSYDYPDYPWNGW